MNPGYYIQIVSHEWVSNFKIMHIYGLTHDDIVFIVDILKARNLIDNPIKHENLYDTLKPIVDNADKHYIKWEYGRAAWVAADSGDEYLDLLASTLLFYPESDSCILRDLEDVFVYYIENEIPCADEHFNVAQIFARSS